MKGFDVSKKIIISFAVGLFLASVLLIILASNEATTSFAAKPIEIKAFIIMLYSALCLFSALWLAVKAFADNKRLYAVLLALAFCVSVASMVFGMYNDKNSTGAFGIGGAVLFVAAAISTVVYLYKNGFNKTCFVLELVFALINTALAVGAYMLLQNESILGQAFVLAVFPSAFALASVAALIYRFMIKSKWIKLAVAGLVLIGIVAYTAAFTAALGCTQNYLTALKLPTRLITSAVADCEITVHKDFSGDNSIVFEDGFTKDRLDDYKRFVGFFSCEANFCEYPIPR